MNLHFPDFDPRPTDTCSGQARRAPVAAWILVALIGAVLGTAALGAALTTDTRTFAERHHSVLGVRAL
jgi:hypothetical protein